MSQLDLRLYQISDQAPEILRQHVLDPLFPRIIDPAGGFQEHYAPDWSPLTNDTRSLVFQSRAVWVASASAELVPDRAKDLHTAARHGLAWLRDHQWDQEHGGFWWQTDPQGNPTDRAQNEKHAYGIAFAIYALAEMARAFGDEDALNLAVRAFTWLDHHAHDRQNRGYYENLSPEGTPLRHEGHPEVRSRPGLIGAAVGFRTFNTHLHLLEAYATLLHVWPEPVVEQRVAELLDLLKNKMYVEPGCFHGHFTADWKPVPYPDSYGHDVEAAFLILEAAGLTDDPDPLATADLARRVVDHAINVALDPVDGSMFSEGDAFGHIYDRRKIWWVQAEALNAFAVLHNLFGHQTDHYAEAILNLWDFVQNHQLDHQDKGFHAELDHHNNPLPRPKLDPWTEGYHQTRALINLHHLLAPQNTIDQD